MTQKTQKVGDTEIKYYTKGDKPKLLIHSGTHGNEAGVISSVIKAVEKYEDQLSDFVFVPEVSPSAVAKKTRNNKDGHDLNRIFTDDSPSDEVRANMEIIDGNYFEIVVTFHEDPELKEFYLYDCSAHVHDQRWEDLKTRVKQLGVNLYSGIDDPDDPDLGVMINDGYVYFEINPQDIDGFIPNWIIGRGHASGVINPEVPSSLDQDTKDKIIDAFFEIFLLRP